MPFSCKGRMRRAFGHAPAAARRAHQPERSVETTIRLWPGRRDYRLALAEVLLRRREYDRAGAALSPVLARSSPTMADPARRLLDTISHERRNGPSHLPPRAPRRLAEGLSPTAIAPSPSLRPVRDGETRVAGRLTQLDCSGVLPRYEFDTERGVLRLTGGRVGGVPIIAYRADAPRSMACGPIHGAPRALVTDVPAAGIDAADVAAPVHGTAVAIEFVPDAFMPRETRVDP